MKHGGDLITYEKDYDGKLVDFSSNINPLGIPKGLTEVLINSFNDLEDYPDIKYRKLKLSIATYLNCNFENILVGNGAVEIINNFIMCHEKIRVATPSFSEYELRAKVHKKEIRKIPYKEGFKLDAVALKDLQEDELLILGNPNNPTGLRIAKDDLLNIYEIVKERNAFLLLDEAFFEFCPEDYDSIELFKNDDYEKVAIIRAATKFFALPGIRLGYSCSSREKVKEVSKIELPWSINSLANAAGQFIFKDGKYIRDSKVHIENERSYLLDCLSYIEGIKVYDTHTNFILIKLLNHDEEYAFKHFLGHGLVIRKCSSFVELADKHIRIAVKDRQNNTRILQAFKNLKNEEE